MAAKNQQGKPKKRKQIPGSKPDGNRSTSKKPKLVDSKPSSYSTNESKKPFKHPKHKQSGDGKENTAPMSKRERRLHAKVDFLCVWYLGFSLYVDL